MTKNEIKMPSVLSFEKKLVLSDGFMYGLNWDAEKNPEPLKISEKSVRGTISNRTTKAELNEYDIESANLQKVDHCSLGEEQNTLMLHFTLKVLGGLDNASTCNDSDFEKNYRKKINASEVSDAIDELAKRYVINIANGRFLWRNRVGAEKIKIVVKQLSEDKKIEKDWTFYNAFEVGLGQDSFDYTDEQTQEISKRVASVLKSKYEENKSLLLEVKAYCKMGKAQDVYPSEELILDKDKVGRGKKSKTLYSINGAAAMHSQKIGNAIRTIDTWYPTNDKDSTKPISIESYGSVTNEGRAYREKKTKKDFYSLFDKWSASNESYRTEKEDLQYIIAMLIRGGVFGKSDKKEKDDKNNENPSQENEQENQDQQ
jgi:CRISPR-associated protein Csy3